MQNNPDCIMYLEGCVNNIQNNVADKRIVIPEVVKGFLENFSAACKTLANSALEDGYESKESEEVVVHSISEEVVDLGGVGVFDAAMDIV